MCIIKYSFVRVYDIWKYREISALLLERYIFRCLEAFVANNKIK